MKILVWIICISLLSTTKFQKSPKSSSDFHKITLQKATTKLLQKILKLNQKIEYLQKLHTRSRLLQTRQKPPIKIPIIGILSQPVPWYLKKFKSNSRSYISASYPKWIEQVGAIAIPIPYTLPLPKIFKLMDQLNGILLPGGDISVFTKSVHKAYIEVLNSVIQKFIKINKSGKHFPIWGTCNGFEQLINYFSNHTIKSTDVKDHRVNKRLSFNKIDLPKTKFGGYLSKGLITNLERKKLSWFVHSNGIYQADWLKNTFLQKNLYSVATSVTEDKVPIISIIEGKNFPIFGTQFHPEKIQFEKSKLFPNMNTSEDSVRASVFLSEILKKEAMKNDQFFQSKKFFGIIRFKNFNVYKTEGVFREVYFFENMPSQFSYH